jgi:DNA-binding CsgD family transcriptional regulator
MPALTGSDAQRLLQFVAEAESLGGDEPFTGELLTELGKLVQADCVTYNELDRVRKRNLLYVGRPGDDDGGELNDSDEEKALFWEFVIEAHPVCLRHQQGDSGALKLSDFLTPRELHRTRLYDVWFRPWEIEHELNVPIPSPLWHTKTFLFDRRGNRDFTERDRLVLERLQPHLARLWRGARTRRLLSAALAAIDCSSARDSRGVILFSRAGRIEFASASARRLLSEFFPGWRGVRVPAAFENWLEGSANGPLLRRRDERQLTIERSGDALLLEVKQPDLLTAREREVLAWVARGKTNAEVAQLLWLAPSTVRKHLENVYAKLGVSTRTAAVASFLGLLDAEAS